MDKTDNKVKKFIYDFTPYVLILIVVILLKVYIISPIQVNGTSMMNTLHDKDIMILNKVNYRLNDIERFDIVVIKYNKTHLIKRVIGLPGDKIEYKDNKLYINDQYYEEPFLQEDTITDDFVLSDVINQKTIPDNFYFVMGDNRGNSLDSRYLGLFEKDVIEGNTSFTLFPFNRFGSKE